ncbi:hypothetical protein KW95_10730 [Clostridioides difficile]|nr:hypothetical protein KW95_10730 [Clostridioides difficile]
MPYATEEYYKNDYGGNLIEDEKLISKLERASDQIDVLTFNRIVTIGFDSLTEFQRDKIKKAACIQADFIYKYGEYIDMPLSGYSAGDISLSFNASTINGITTTNEIINYLSQTGLTCRKI